MSAFAYLYSPIGMVELRGSGAGLHAVRFLDRGAAVAPTAPAAVAGCLKEAHGQVRAYFGRELRNFSLPCEPETGTAFQRQVWAALSAVAYGRTASYLDLARQLANHRAVRAVGAANGQNPLALVWPCHRIIGADGSLTGYAGGLPRKRWLLDFERPHRQGGLFG